MEARDAVSTERTQGQVRDFGRLGWYHSIELNDGTVIPGVQTIERLRKRLDQFAIPRDLRGKRVLDIGAWDGWFTFEMERRGAEVVAVDSTEHDTFHAARDLLGSKAEYVIEDVCRLSPAKLGHFDIVLFLGVLYHLKHPLLGLERVCELCTDMACVESFVTENEHDRAALPRLDFYETAELGGQFDNWFGPNISCLMAMCRTAGFARARFESVYENRAHLTCFRKWAPDQTMTEAAPLLICVENAITLNFDFSLTRDDYLTFVIESPETGLTADEIFMEIGPYASRPVWVHDLGSGGWHVNCKLPPGLAPGWHAARARIRGSAWSNPLRIGVDVRFDPTATPPSNAAGAPEIVALTDGRTWERNRVRGGGESWLSLWAKGLPAKTTRHEIVVRVNGTELGPKFLSEPDGDGVQQINVPLPTKLKSGNYRLTLSARGRESQAALFELVDRT